MPTVLNKQAECLHVNWHLPALSTATNPPLCLPISVAPINEPTTTTTQAQSQSQRKIGNINSTTSSSSSHHMTTTNSSNSSTTTVTTQQKEQVGGTAASTTSKVYIKKTGSSNNSTTSSTTTTASSSAGRKESFGSRDSLNDILSETGLSTGNVAATRKSLENKNLDLTKPPGAAISQQRSSTSSATLTTTVGTGLAASAVSKSLENMDEKVKSPPPPVLSKKPSVPLKKTPTGGVPMVGAGEYFPNNYEWHSIIFGNILKQAIFWAARKRIRMES